MKIAVWHNLPSGGGKRALYHQVQGLVERGHQVEAWCPPTADQTYLPLSQLIKEVVVPLDPPPPPFRPFSRFWPGYGPHLDLIQTFHRHSQRCAAQISQGGFDLVFAHACAFFHSPGIGRYLTLPKVLYLQEPYRPFYEARPQLPWLALPPAERPSLASLRQFWQNLVETQKFRVQAREELSNAKAFDRILVNSAFSRESVLRAYGLEAKVCYLGIDPDLFRPLGLLRQNLVVGLGTLYKGKGVDRAIQAIATIEPALRPTLLWIGNSVDQRFYLEMAKLAAVLGVQFEAKTLVSDQALVELLNQAAVMIYPPVLEPFGFAPLEANACETPVVAIAEGGVRETIQEGVNGFLIPDNDPVALGQALARLLTDPDLRAEMGQRARQQVLEQWSWTRSIDRLEQLLAL